MLALLVAEEGAHHENNFWYGDINEVIWGTISFLILLAAFLKWGVPAIKKAMAQQREGIAEQIDTAEARRTQAEAQLGDIRAQLSDADAETERILVEAREAAGHLRTDLTQRAEQDLVELRARAESEIASSRDQAVADLHSEVSGLALGAAETVVERNLDHDTQVQLIENYINQVGAQAR
jgi:F-type H+-transporting ATPase subunit b